MVEEQEVPEGTKIKIVCPSCGGSFKGRLPAKPARGVCPRCQKELVLLPSGAIDTETQFRRREGDVLPIPEGATPAAPVPPEEKEEETPVFQPEGDASIIAPPMRPLVIRDRVKDYGIAVALLLVGWIISGALVILQEKPQVVRLGEIGTRGLAEFQAKVCGCGQK